jgi:glycosyltransferase involved in cell wall biosynthesis
MNVLLATDYFPPHVGGGVEQVTYHMAEELTKLGHRVAVLTLNTCRASFREDVHGIDVYRARPLELTNVLGMQSAVSTEVGKLMQEICRREQIDVLHANNLYFYTTLAACLYPNSSEVPLVTTLHVGQVSKMEGIARYLAKFYENSIGRWILAKSKHVIAVSRAVGHYAETMGVDSSKISVIPNAVDTLKFRPSPHEYTRDGTTRVGFLGRLISNKGPQYLVEAAQHILSEFSNVQFHIAGDGPLLQQLQRRVHRLGVDRAFRFYGMVPSVPDFMHSCDIMVRPSLTDGMPLTVLEAMACGLPNVASNVGGTSEILQDGKTGYLVEPRNVGQLISRISNLVANPELRLQMGREARLFIERYYSWNRIARKLSIIYEDVLRN